MPLPIRSISLLMQITETLYVATRAAWRAWLKAHHTNRPDIWLVSYRANSGRPSVSYNDAVEEALCFGWIDSTRKRLDDACYAQRFSPRRPGSSYSQTNKERLARLIARGRVDPAVLPAVRDLDAAAFIVPNDILTALRADEHAWTFFQQTSASYQRIRAAYVDAARARPDEFTKRLQHLVRMSAQGRQFGYGIETYY